MTNDAPTYTVLQKRDKLFITTDSNAFNLVLTENYDVIDIEMSMEDAEAYVVEAGQQVWYI